MRTFAAPRPNAASLVRRVAARVRRADPLGRRNGADEEEGDAPEASDRLDYVSAPPESLLCPVCGEVPLGCVVEACGHSLCATCHARCAALAPALCPICRASLPPAPTPNHLVRALLDDLLVHCRFRRAGCTAKVRAAEKRTHEAYCAHAPVRCLHARVGCPFVGSRGALEAHLTACPYEALRVYIAAADERHAALVARLDALERRLAPPAPPPAQPKPAPPAPAADAPPRVEPPRLVCRVTLLGHSRGVSALALRDRTLFSGSHDASILVWHLADALLPLPSADALAAADAPPPAPVATLTGHESIVWSLALTAAPDGAPLLFSASADSTVRVWAATAPFTALRTLRGHHSKVYSLAALGAHVYSAGADHTIRRWPAAANAAAADCTVAAHKDAIWALSAADGVLCSASEDCSARLWSPALEPLRAFSAPPSKALAVALHADYVFVATHDCGVQVWRRADGRLERTLTGHVWEVWQLRLFHSGGHCWLLSGSFDHTIRVWSLQSWACVQVLEGHKGYIHALAPAALGPLIPNALLSASGDKSIKIWY